MIWQRPALEDGDLRAQADADQLAIEDAMQELPLGRGLVTRAISVGRGLPVVCVPMVAELNFVYAPLLEELSATRRVVVYEPNLSRESRVGVLDRAQELRSVLDALSIDAAHVVAWSDAGAAAYIFARESPDRCLSLGLLGLADRYVFPWPVQRGIEMLARWPLERAIPAVVMAGFLSHYLRGPQVKRRLVFRRARKVPKLSRLFKCSVLPNLVDHSPLRGEVDVPAIVVCGDCDCLVAVDQARRMAELLGPRGSFKVLPGGEHFLGYVHHREVTEILQDFYAGLMPDPGR